MIAGIKQREAIIVEAKTWLCTPWHHAAAVKGAGVDCARFLIEVYANAGLIDRFIPDAYPQDFAQHSSYERFIDNLENHAYPVEYPGMGDVAVWKYGKCFSHGAIVLCWPQIIHAKIYAGVIYDLGNAGDLEGRPVKFYSVFSS